MKVVFMGTPEFAAYQLEQLILANFTVVGVVTMPDKAMGRGMKVGQSPVKELAIQNSIPVLQPEKLRDESFLQELQSWNADVFVVVAFRMLPALVWKMPVLGTLNLHASLLPQYRGAAPINWAIVNGETETGVTTFFIQEEIDTGDVLLREKVSIDPEDSAGSLHDKLMVIGSQTIINTLVGIQAGTLLPVQQDKLQVSELKSAPKIFKETCEINWDQPSKKVIDFVRGMSPYPAAWSKVLYKDGRTQVIKVYKTALGSGSLKPREVYSDGRTFLEVGTSDGAVSVLELQLEGKKRMDIRSFMMGFDLSTIASLG